jgi:tetratricopeptide (TPR) repeat protein
MGRVIHPAANAARKASSARDFRAVSEILSEALEKAPGNADLVCEHALLRMMQGRESEALELLPIAGDGKRFKLLQQLLCDHLYCRMLLNSVDHRASRHFSLLSTDGLVPTPTVGVKLSACLIVRDEEDHLERCLRSLRGVVDEIVVVDTGSQDASKLIAERHDAVISDFVWCDDFSAARNAALELATGNWILWIDADEELVPESLAAIHRAIVRPQFGGFDIEIVNFTENRSQGEQFRHCPTRLFQKLAGVRFTGRIHEQITPSLVELSLPWARLEGARLLHYGYMPGDMEKKSKLDRTISMLEREVSEQPTDAFQWFNLANAYIVAGRPAETAHAASRCADLMTPGATYGENCFQIWAQALTSLDNPEGAIEVCRQAAAAKFDGPFVLFERCQALLRANRPQEALEDSNALMAVSAPQGASGDPAIFTYKRLVVHGQILAVLGRFEDSLHFLNQALEIDPEYSAALYSQGAVLEKMGRLGDALASFSRAAWDTKSFCLAMKGCGRALVGIGRTIEAATAFKRAWDRCPEDLEAWIGWTGACEASGDIRTVLEAYEALARVQEPSSEMYINWGRALDASGQAERALRCFGEAIKLDPGSANAYFNCGDLLYRSGAMIDAAHLYEAGLQIRPDYADGWFTLGNALARTGLVPQAVIAYEKALAHNPKHQGAFNNLSVVRTEPPLVQQANPL